MKRGLNDIILYVFILSIAIMGYFSLDVDKTKWFIRFNYFSIVLGIIAIISNKSYLSKSIKKIRNVYYFVFVLIFLNIINEYGEGHYLRALMIMCATLVGFIIGGRFGLEKAKSYFKIFAFILFPLLVLFTFKLNGNINYGTTEGHIRDKLFLLPLLFPFVIIMDNKKYNLVSLVVLTICSFISLKRSIVIVGLLLLLIYVYYTLPNRNKNKVWKLVLLIGIVMGIIFLFPKLDRIITNGAVVERLNNSQEDGGSGRDEMYTQYLTILQNSQARELFLGQKSNIITGNAHNDILIITYRYGLVGLLLYFSIIIGYIKQAVLLSKNKYFPDTGRVLIWSTNIPIVVLGMLNCFFDQCSFYYGMLLIGYIIGMGTYYSKIDTANLLETKI